jgi:outer membrane protein assembly factor BamA
LSAKTDHEHDILWKGMPQHVGIVLLCVGQCLANTIDIEFSGNTFYSSRYLMSNIHTATTEHDVENVIQRVLTTYSNAGFPFCRIVPEIVYSDSIVEKIILHIDEGERVVITDYIVDVAGKTEIGAIKKIARLQTNKYFSSKDIGYSKNILLKTGAFDEIGDNIIKRDGRHYVLLTITEKKSDYLVAYGSFGRHTFDDNEYNFGFSFSSVNLLGTLRQLEFRYEYKKLFLVQFTEPILIAPSIFHLHFSLSTYDSVRLAEFNGTFTAPLGHHFTVSLTTGIEAVSYYDDDVDDEQRINNIVGVGGGMDYATRNWSCAQKINFTYLFREHDRRSVTYNGTFELFSLVVRPHYYWVQTDSFEYFDYFRIGGSRDMRGYLDEEFTVRKALWVNIEYRKFFIFPLIDIGFIGDDFQYSYGFGIGAESDFANASLVFAWPRGGTWGDGKVHVLFEKGF